MTFGRRVLVVSCLIASVLSQSAYAEGAPQHWSVPLRTQITRVNAVDWKLSRVAAPRCAPRAAGTGMALDSLAAYPEGERSSVASALGMTDGVVVVAVAPGSPADLAGIRVGDRIDTISGHSVAALAGDRPDLVSEAATDMLAASSLDRAITLTIWRAGYSRDIALTPLPRCAARSILTIDDRVDAYSDAKNLALTTGLTDFVANDDELALLAGHELAHIVLASELEKAGIRNKRKEAAADKLGAEIASCAGYDIGLASHFWDRFDSTRLLGFLPTLTHPRSATRKRDIAAMAGKVDCSGFASVADAAQSLP